MRNLFGTNYEFVQRNLEINHIAIVDQGRAGPEVAIRNDSDTWQIEGKGETSNMPTLRLTVKIMKCRIRSEFLLGCTASTFRCCRNANKDFDACRDAMIP
ncbi:DUF2213 domain-containing protein [Fictibacillus enclensis]|uniref:DUF2213 domain-containing protein n=1 Tax=Fictibacillus enclensis TaxID=1017270 RepID=UPI00333C6C87